MPPHESTDARRCHQLATFRPRLATEVADLSMCDCGIARGLAWYRSQLPPDRERALSRSHRAKAGTTHDCSAWPKERNSCAKFDQETISAKLGGTQLPCWYNGPVGVSRKTGIT